MCGRSLEPPDAHAVSRMKDLLEADDTPPAENPETLA
jgi:hypothetical protein